MAWSPSGKARVCKTLIRGFDSRPGLQNYNYLKNAGRIRYLLKFFYIKFAKNCQ